MMKMSTMRGMAAGGMLGMTIGAGLMMTSQGKRMKKILLKDGGQMARRMKNIWLQ